LILVSAGPSLNDALAVLPRVAGKALVLATGTAARILVNHGVRVDAVVSIDPNRWNRAHFEGWDCSSVPLVYYHRVDCEILRLHAGRKFWFQMRGEPPLPGAMHTEPPPFRRGGTVAYSALQLAHFLDADPIVFVGQDFAFAGGHTHAAGALYDRPYDEGAERPDHFKVPGVDGTLVATNRTYYDYLLLMQDYLLEYVRVHPRTAHINVSRTGARIRGMVPGTLEEVFESRSPHAAPPSRIFEAASHEFEPPRPEACRAAVTRFGDELRSLLADRDAATFEQLFARFTGTSLHAQAPRSYDDVFYVYESRYRSGPDEARARMLSRFRTHLEQARESLEAALPV
jgi:hypothetical protein